MTGARVVPVLYRDARFAVLDKPAGMPVHPARGGAAGSSVEEGFGALGRFRAGPWLAHRLDRDTAGCLLVALRRSALVEAQRCFASGVVEKTYWAVVRGGPAGESGVRRSFFTRAERGGRWWMVEGTDGERAETAWRVIGRGEGIAALELQPRTGRTHQVRVHCAGLGCPVLGDAVYGAGGDGVPLQLLARGLRVPVAPAVAATAPVPAHMRAMLERCGVAG